MKNSTESKLEGFVNSSGFPLQIGIKNAVEAAARDQKWAVMAEEHPWKNTFSHESGFIDLILDHYNRTQRLVVECKRVKDCQWIFLIPSNDSTKCERAKSWTTFQPYLVGWIDCCVKPASFESKFCVVKGQDQKSKPMLERLGSQLIEATEAFAQEEFSLGVPESDIRAYFPVIVTTADLKICSFDSDEIDIRSGEIKHCTFQDVQSIRFRKSLTARNEEVAAKDLQEMFKEKERTVFVVNSASFIEFLSKWEYVPPRSLK